VTGAGAIARRACVIAVMTMTVVALMRLFTVGPVVPASSVATEVDAVQRMASAWDGAIRFGAPYAALDPSRAGDDAAPAAGFNPADDYWGLPRTPGFDDVAGWCGACHSLALVMQQRQTADGWTTVIERMVARQGMPDPGGRTRADLAAYLAREFGRE